jgi:hypothetical protein
MKKSWRTVLAAAAVWLTPAIARAQGPKQPVIPTLGVPGIVALGVVLGLAGLKAVRKRK